VSVALVIQHAKRKRHLSSVACLAPPYLSTLSGKWHDFRGGGGGCLNTKCVSLFSLQLLSEAFLILQIIQRDSVINVHGSSCKVPVILVRF
jgi:hypothetical protein